MSENVQQETVTIGGETLPVEVVDGKKQAVSKDGNVYVLGPQEQKQRKLSKIDLKRMEQYQARRKRLLGQGVAEDKVDQVIAEEDYKALPIEQKFERFAMSTNQSFHLFGQDVNALQHNIQVTADAVDVNSKAIAMIFEKLGISLEQQKEIVKEATELVNKEREERRLALQKKREEEAKMRQAMEEGPVAEAALRKAEGKPDLVDQPGEPAPIPEGATEFGG